MHFVAIFLALSSLGTTLAAPSLATPASGDPTKPGTDKTPTPNADKPKGDGDGNSNQDATGKGKLKAPSRLGEDISFSQGSEGAWGRLIGAASLLGIVGVGHYLDRYYSSQAPPGSSEHPVPDPGDSSRPRSNPQTPPTSKGPGITEAAGWTNGARHPGKFQPTDYGDVQALRKALVEYVDEREDPWGYLWVHDCSLIRWQYPEPLLAAVQSCAQQYADWVEGHGRDQKMPWPTVEREIDRRRRMAKERRQPKAERADGGDHQPLQFSTGNLAGLRKGMNRAALQGIRPPPTFAFQPPKLLPKHIPRPVVF